MIRAIVKPQNQDISIHVPENYVGRELEILLYPVDELTETNTIKKSSEGLRGSMKMSAERYNDFQQYLKDVRNEWERDI